MYRIRNFIGHLFFGTLSIFTLPWKDLIFHNNSNSKKVAFIHFNSDGMTHNEYVCSLVSQVKSSNLITEIYIFIPFFGKNYFHWGIKDLDVIFYPNFDKTNIKVIRSDIFQIKLLSLFHFFDDFSSIIIITEDWWPFQVKGKNLFPKFKVFSIMHTPHWLPNYYEITSRKYILDLNDGKNNGFFFPNVKYLVQNQNGLQFLPNYVKKQVFYLTQLPYYKSEPESKVYQKTFCAMGNTLIGNDLVEPIKETFQNNPELKATFWMTQKGISSTRSEEEIINSGAIIKYKNLSYNDLFLKLTTSDFVFVWGFDQIDTHAPSGVSTMLQYVYNYQIIPIVPKQIWVDIWKLDPKIALTYSTPEELEKVVISAMKLSSQKILEMKHQIFKYFQEQTKIMKSMVENEILS